MVVRDRARSTSRGLHTFCWGTCCGCGRRRRWSDEGRAHINLARVLIDGEQIDVGAQSDATHQRLRVVQEAAAVPEGLVPWFPVLPVRS